MKKLFGTDGIRGVAGQPPLDPPTIHAVGLALAHHLGRDHRDQPPRVLIGQDTRESSDWIAATLAAGLAAAGATVESAGVITTPAVAFLARAHSFAAGIVISASHNPWQDNGIKLFGPDGYKLPDATELAIETEIFRHLNASTDHLPLTTYHSLQPNQADRAEYIRFLLTAVPGLSLDGRRLVVDCANGAASAIAPQLFAELNSNGGGEVLLTHASPNGRNINEHCGALHPEIVAAEVAKHKASMGITFDGDADRALFADENGKVVNGDAVLLLAARDLAAHGLLANRTVVATTMSNMGLEAALRRDGIRMLRAPVGDKYVLERMQPPEQARSAASSRATFFSPISPPPATVCSPPSSSSTSSAAPVARFTNSSPTSKFFPRSSSTFACARKNLSTKLPLSRIQFMPPKRSWPRAAASSSAIPALKPSPAS
jgi:phosphoglucosamine mutase